MSIRKKEASGIEMPTAPMVTAEEYESILADLHAIANAIFDTMAQKPDEKENKNT